MARSTVAIVLILIGALSKSAIVPFHFWLPGAMAAPTPVSAYLHAAAMVKAGIYLVARLAPAFADLASWRVMVLGLGLVTMCSAGWRALREYDLKLVLAFGTVSQLGFLMVLVGHRRRAMWPWPALAMLVAHALFKAALFMVVGIIDHSTGTRDLRKLARLGKRRRCSRSSPPWPRPAWPGCRRCSDSSARRRRFETICDTGALGAWRGPVVVDRSWCSARSSPSPTALRFIWGAFGRKGKTEPSPAVAKMHKPNLAVPAAAPACSRWRASPSGRSSALLGARLSSPTPTPSPATLRRTRPPRAVARLQPAAAAHARSRSCSAPRCSRLVRELGRLGFVKPALGNADRIYDAVLRGADTHLDAT